MPKPIAGESPSDYMDRMLGKVGSAERKLADDTTYQYYLKQWDAFQKRDLVDLLSKWEGVIASQEKSLELAKRLGRMDDVKELGRQIRGSRNQLEVVKGKVR